MFDVMTDWEARLAAEGPFLKSVLEDAGAGRVLDAACGSGGHALWLARQGYEVAGADVSPVMIALAQQKAAAADLGVPFVVSDLANLQASLDLRRRSLPGQFAATPADAGRPGGGAAGDGRRPAAGRGARPAKPELRPALAEQPRWFMAQGGVLDGQEVLVWRFADYDVPAGRIAFHIALFRKGVPNWPVEVHPTPHRPLFQADLLAALTEAGFSEPPAYGRMTLPEEPFDVSSSGDLVVLAQKD